MTDIHILLPKLSSITLVNLYTCLPNAHITKSRVVHYRSTAL